MVVWLLMIFKNGVLQNPKITTKKFQQLIIKPHQSMDSVIHLIFKMWPMYYVAKRNQKPMVVKG
ncbi:hypothetical protein A6767_02825 [Aeromonas veronii]|nr:hypothetical protein A6767_02825 [Aeromonas veronii]